MLHISFFFQLMMGFHMNFLMGIFSNFRFFNFKSTFGIINFALTILTLLFLLGLLIVSIIKQRKIEEVVAKVKQRPHRL